MWKDLRVEHIVHLTDEQVQEYIEKEKLVRGIPIELTPPEKPVSSMPAKDATLYQFGDLFFENAEDAAKMSALALALGAMDYNSYSKRDYRSNYNKITDLSNYRIRVEACRVWSPEAEKSLPVDKCAYDRELEEYNDALAIYERHSDHLYELTQTILDEVGHFRRMYAKVSVLVDKFAAYLEKSGGHADRAFEYFEMAYGVELKRLEDTSEYAEQYNSRNFFYNMFFDHTGVALPGTPAEAEDYKERR